MIRGRQGFDRDERRRALLEQLGQVGSAKAPVLPPTPAPRPPGGGTGTPIPYGDDVVRHEGPYQPRPNPFTGGYVAPGTQPPPPATFPTPSQQVGPSMQPLSAGQGPQRPGRPERPGQPPQAPAAPTVTTAPTTPAPTPYEQAQARLEQERIDRLNRQRQERGLPPIQPRPESPERPDPEGDEDTPVVDYTQPPAEGAEAPAGELPEGWVTVNGLSMPSDWGAYAGPGHMEGYGVSGGPSSYGEASAENPHFGRQYQVSRILSHIDPDADDSLKQAHEAFQKAGIAHQWDGFDRFDFGNGWVDLKHNKRFVKTGQGPNDWTYLEQGGAGGTAEGVGGRGTTEGALGAPGMSTEQLVTLFSTDPRFASLATPSPQFLAFMAGLTEAEQSQIIKQLLTPPGTTPPEDEEEAPTEDSGGRQHTPGGR